MFSVAGLVGPLAAAPAGAVTAAPAGRVVPHSTPSGLGPTDLQKAYKLLSSANGGGATVALIEGYDDPNAVSDLATYRSQYGLPACGTGCLTKVDGDGQPSPLPPPDPGNGAGDYAFARETSLDLDMVSAVCPNCHILLVEVQPFPGEQGGLSLIDVGTGVNSAVALGAKYVSISLGFPEPANQNEFDQDYFNHPGVAIVAAGGDYGYATELSPAVSQYVTAVGGTTLSTASNSRGWNETVWSNGYGRTSGSGCSAYTTKPPWQTDTGCVRRTNNDIAASAGPMAVRDTYGSTGWITDGGTSAATPIIAAAYALAGVPVPGTYPASYIYQHPGSLFDITSGSTGSCGGSYLCTALAGYDAPTGWGTPNGLAALSGTPTGLRVGDRSVGRNKDGRLELFATDSLGEIWHNWQISPGGAWNGWSNLGGSEHGLGLPTVGQDLDGRLEVDAAGSDGQIWTDWQTSPGGAWNGWATHGGTNLGTPAIGRNSDGRLQLFAADNTGTIWTTFQATANGAWTSAGWSPLGGHTGLGNPAVGQNLDGRLEVYASGGGIVWGNWQTSPGGAWSGWFTHGGSGLGAPAAGRNKDGRLELFASDASGAVWHTWQATANGSWTSSGWSDLGSSNLGIPTVGQDLDGRLEVYATTGQSPSSRIRPTIVTGVVWANWQTTPGGAWNGWASHLGAGLGNPAVINNSDGRLEMFASDSSGVVWHKSQTAPNGSWNSWAPL